MSFTSCRGAARRHPSPEGAGRHVAPRTQDVESAPGRISVPGARYFVTACTKDRVAAFTEHRTAARTLEVLRNINTEDVEILTATLMPDHVHLLFALGGRLSLGQVIAKFKTLAREMGHASWEWQRDSFEHRLRAHESAEDYAFYIFMNPYRANLISVDENWPWWLCPDATQFTFLSRLDGGQCVPREWLGCSEEISQRIVIRA